MDTKVNAGFSLGLPPLAPVVPAAPASSTVLAPVSAPALPALPPRTSLRELAIFGGMNLLSIGGVAAALSLAGTGPALVAATLGTTLTVAATAARLLTGQRPEKTLVSALESERLAVDSTRRMLEVQATGLAVDRERVAGETQSLIAMREALQSDRARDRQAVEEVLDTERGKIAERVAALVELEMAPLREQLQRDRDALARDRTAFEGHKAGLLAPIAAEVDGLSRKELQAIHHAIEAYTSNATHRFVAQPYPEHGDVSPLSEPLAASEVLTTLMKHGRVYAGPTSDPGSHVRFYSVLDTQATALTSVAELSRFLRAATGKKV